MADYHRTTPGGNDAAETPHSADPAPSATTLPAEAASPPAASPTPAENGTGITRRGLMASGAAIAAGGAVVVAGAAALPAIAETDADAALLALWHKRCDVKAQSDEIERRGDAIYAQHPHLHCDNRPQVVVKKSYGNGIGYDYTLPVDHRTDCPDFIAYLEDQIGSALHIQVLPGKTEPTPDQVAKRDTIKTRLVADYRRQRAAWDPARKEAGFDDYFAEAEELGDLLSGIDREIYETPAQSWWGVALKLHLGVDRYEDGTSDVFEPMLFSACDDAKRLVGGLSS